MILVVNCSLCFQVVQCKGLCGDGIKKKKKTKQKIKFMQNSSGKRIEASQGKLNEVIKATAFAAHIFVQSNTISGFLVYCTIGRDPLPSSGHFVKLKTEDLILTPLKRFSYFQGMYQCWDFTRKYEETQDEINQTQSNRKHNFE